MFKNAIKKFASVGLVFSLCVPCCFASAQKMPTNLFIPSNSGGNRTNRQNIGDFRPFFRAMQQVAQQRNLAAVEKLYNTPLRRIGNLCGYPIQSSRDLANVVIKLESDPIRAFFRLKEVFLKIIEATPEDVAELVAYAIHDIYMMDDEQYIDFLKRLLRRCDAPENELELRANALFEEYKSKYPN